MTAKTWRILIMATRPGTLLAAVGPVAVGGGLAIGLGAFKPAAFLACLAVAVILQIAINLANDYYDGLSGVDAERRFGSTRVTQNGLVPARMVIQAVYFCLAVTIVPIGYLIYLVGWPAAVVAVACAVTIMIYSGGPFPLASHALGDLAVFIFFGPIAAVGTFYAQTQSITFLSVLAASAVGFLITAILVVNNLRDMESDKRAGKYTLAVLLGKQGTRVESALLWAGAYALVIIAVLAGLAPWPARACLATAPWAFQLVKRIFRQEGSVLNESLAATAKLSLVFSVLLSVGLAMTQ